MVVVMVGAITVAGVIIMDGGEAEATIMVGGIIIGGDQTLCSEEAACLAAFLIRNRCFAAPSRFAQLSRVTLSDGPAIDYRPRAFSQQHAALFTPDGQISEFLSRAQE